MAGVTRTGGYTSYDSSGTPKFVPELFANKMLRNFYQTTCMSEISNTDLTF